MAVPPVRTSIVFTQRQADRLREISEKHGISRNKFITAVATVLSDTEVKSIIQRFDEWGRLEKELRSEADAQMREIMKGRSVEELRAMLQAAQRAGT